MNVLRREHDLRGGVPGREAARPVGFRDLDHPISLGGVQTSGRTHGHEVATRAACIDVAAPDTAQVRRSVWQKGGVDAGNGAVVAVDVEKGLRRIGGVWLKLYAIRVTGQESEGRHGSRRRCVGATHAYDRVASGGIKRAVRSEFNPVGRSRAILRDRTRPVGEVRDPEDSVTGREEKISTQRVHFHG